MKLKHKLWLSFSILSAGLFTTPLALSLTSCGPKYLSSDVAKESAFFDYTKASLTLPSNVTNENINTFFNFDNFSVIKNGYYYKNATIAKDENGNNIFDDLNGTLTVEFEKHENEVVTKTQHVVSGFLTIYDYENNLDDSIKPTWDNLNILNSNGKLILNAKPGLKFNDVLHSSVDTIIDENDPIYISLKNLNNDIEILGLDGIGAPVIKNGVSFPIITKTVKLKSKTSGLTSSQFQLEIRGFEHSLSLEDVKILLDLGSNIKLDIVQNTFATELNEENINKIYNKYFLTNIGLETFQNFGNIKFEYVPNSLIHPEDNKGSILLTFLIYMGDNSDPVSHQITINGFITQKSIKSQIFSTIKTYRSDKNLNISLTGRNLPNELKNYKFEKLVNGIWVVDNEPWNISLFESTQITKNINTTSNKIIFSRKQNDNEKIVASKITLLNAEIALSDTYKDSLSIYSNMQNQNFESSYFNLNNSTASIIKQNNYINKEWIFTNINKFISSKRSSLIKSSNDILDVRVNIKEIKQQEIINTLYCSFVIAANKTYNSDGLINSDPVLIRFKINNFKNYEILSNKNSILKIEDLQKDINIFDHNGNLYTSKIAKQELSKSDNLWILKNISKIANGTQLINNINDFQNVQISEDYDLNEPTRNLIVQLTVKPWKHYDQNGLLSNIPKNLNFKIEGFRNYDLLDLSKNQFEWQELNKPNNEINNKIVWLQQNMPYFIWLNKDIIFKSDKSQTALFTSYNDISEGWTSTYIRVSNSKVKFEVKFQIKPKHHYNLDGTVSLEESQLFTITINVDL